MADQPRNLPVLQSAHGPGIVVLTAALAALLLGLGVVGLVRAVTIDRTTRPALTDAACREVVDTGAGGTRTVCTVLVTGGQAGTAIEVDDDVRAGEEVGVELAADGTVRADRSRVGLVIVAVTCFVVGGGAAYAAVLVRGGALSDDPLRRARRML